MASQSRDTQPRRPADSTPPPPAAKSQTQQRRPRTRVDDVRALVQTRLRQPIETLLAKRQDFERFARVFLTVVEANGDLIRCTDGSLARAFMHSAQVNLQVGTAYPHAYLIPYWNKDLEIVGPNGAVSKGAYEAQFQISVWGYTELLRRAGVRKVWADVVCENDEFECISGTDGKIVKHRPNWFLPREKRGKVLGSYACALLQNGETICEPVSFEELMKAKAANRGKSPAWDAWPEQQYQKVAIKRLSKYCPKGEELDAAMSLDEDPGSGEVIDVQGESVAVDYVETQPANGGAANGPLDEVVAQARAQQAAQAATGAAGAGEARIDRDKLFEHLVAVDERWREQRSRVDGWDEFEALSAAAFCNAVFRDINGTGAPPELPQHMRIFPNDFGDPSSGVIS